MMDASTKRGKGRRPKFDEPRRPVTVTLPRRTLARLAAVDPDRARAIVKLAEYTAASRGGELPAVDVVNVAPGVGVILVGPLRSLRRIGFLQLVEVAPGRHLLTVPTGTAIESLEMEILDLLDNLARAEEAERPVLEKLRGVLSQQRKKKAVSKREFLLIAT